MPTRSPFLEVTELIKETGGEAINQCYQCGTCSATCPWRDYVSFLPRKMFGEARLGLTDFESDNLWRCVTCNKCVQRCPRGVPIIDIMRALRRAVTVMGIANTPTALESVLKNLAATGNPMGEASENRNAWAEGLNIKEFDATTDYLFYPCCVTAYDPAQKNSIKSAATVLSAAGINFGILNDVVCCGESARKSGAEDLFQQLASGNTSTFNRHEVTRIIVNSPHCYHTLTTEYPELDGKFEVIHISQLVSDLFKTGRIPLSKDIKRRVTYHDPCYLGRHSNIYDEPRKIITALPGVELVEMTPSGPDSLCCGGGGGRIWMETPKDERFSDTRLQQAVNTGAEALITTCPYCLSNFRDSGLNQTLPEGFAILDINELIAQAL